MYWSDKSKEMVGATLLDVFAVTSEYNPMDIEEVHLVTDQGTYRAWAEGDCCAHAWIDEVVVGTAVGGTILGVNTQDERTVDGGYDVRDAFTEVVSTTLGDMAMFTFCEHNGYYSGWIVWS